MAPSWIWEHLRKDPNGKTATCNHCNKKLSFTGGNGALLYHLQKCYSLCAPAPDRTVLQFNTPKTSIQIPGTSVEAPKTVGINMSCRDASGRQIATSTIKQKAAVGIAAQGQITQWASASST